MVITCKWKLSYSLDNNPPERTIHLQIIIDTPDSRFRQAIHLQTVADTPGRMIEKAAIQSSMLESVESCSEIESNMIYLQNFDDTTDQNSELEFINRRLFAESCIHTDRGNVRDRCH